MQIQLSVFLLSAIVFTSCGNAKIISSKNFDLTLIIDDASVELFADGGLTLMTSIFFPDENYSGITIQSPRTIQIKLLEFTEMKSMYE